MNTTANAAEEQVFTGRAEPIWISRVLALITIFASSLTLWDPGILKGPAAMNGSARGTALILMIVAVPLSMAASHRAALGSVRSLMLWAGGLAYIAYNAFVLLFETPFNSLFLPYVAMFGLSVAGIACLLLNVEGSRIHTNGLPARRIAIYIWVVAGLNALAWLKAIIPATVTNDSGSLLRGTGLTTNAIYAQDLAFWLPAMTVIAYWLWHLRPWGVLLTGAGLTFWVLEAVGVAVDQWFGSHADSASTVTSMAAVPFFATFAAIGLIPLLIVLRSAVSPRTLVPESKDPWRCPSVC